MSKSPSPVSRVRRPSLPLSYPTSITESESLIKRSRRTTKKTSAVKTIVDPSGTHTLPPELNPGFTKKRAYEATTLASGCKADSKADEEHPRVRQRTSSSASIDTIRAKPKNDIAGSAKANQVSPDPNPQVKNVASSGSRALTTVKKLKDKLKPKSGSALSTLLDPGHGRPAANVSGTDSASQVQTQGTRKKPGVERLASLRALDTNLLRHRSGSVSRLLSRTHSKSSIDLSPDPFAESTGFGFSYPSSSLPTAEHPNPISSRSAPVEPLDGNTTFPQTPRRKIAPVQSQETHAVKGSATIQSPLVVASPKRDAWGCVHLDAAHLDLSVTFFGSPHFEIWDVKDDICIAWPAQIHLTCKDSDRWEGIPLAIPDISLLDIQCHTLSYPAIIPADSVYSYSLRQPDSFSVSYTGATTRDEQGHAGPISYDNGIHIEPEWVRTYIRRDPQHVSASNGKENDAMGHNGKGKPTAALRMPGKRGWALKIWIPIPTGLFMKSETRTFNVEAKVWTGQTKGGEDDGGEWKWAKDGVLEECDAVKGEAIMSVSHLRREREMVCRR